MFFFSMLELSVVDLLCEGKYAELMVTRPRTGSDLVTWVWASYMTGTMLAACIIGPVADALSPNVLFYICIPLALQVCTRVLFVCPQLTPPQILWPALRGYLPETQLPAGERGVRWDKFRKQPQLFYLAAVMALAALGLVFVNLFLSLLAQVSTVGVCLSQLLSALNTNPAESFVHRPLNCSPSTVCPQLSALNCPRPFSRLACLRLRRVGPAVRPRLPVASAHAGAVQHVHVPRPGAVCSDSRSNGLL